MKDKCVQRKAPEKRKKYNIKGPLEDYIEAQANEEDQSIQDLLL